jgi:hypothetical protein
MEEARRSIDTSIVSFQAQLPNFISDWITSELLYQEALKQGIENNSVFQRQLDDARHKFAIQDFLQRQVYADSSKMDDDTLRGYHEAHRDEFIAREDMMQLNIAGFSAREQASVFAGRVSGKIPWGDALQAVRHDSLAREYLVSGSSGQYYSRHTLFPQELWKVGSNLATNQISYPFKTSVGYFVVQLLSSVGQSKPAPYEMVRDEIRSRLLVEEKRRKYNELVGSLRKQYNVEVLLPPAEKDSLRKSSGKQ